MKASSVIVLEFNELTPRLIDRFIAEGQLPNFARLRSESTVMVTDPEEQESALEPWIQWVTVHTGCSSAEHGIEKLGEANLLRHDTIGQVVAANGGDVWLCGSMNLPRSAAGGGGFLPDPWNPDARPEPEDFRVFSDFVRSNVQEHSNVAAEIDARSLVSFGWFLARHGLTFRTVRAAMMQLSAERRGTRGRWARASVLDRFQWDLFRWRWKQSAPQFATFFSNSTAHYQHLFWRNLEPEQFVHRPSSAEQAQYGDAILHGYRSMDSIVGEALELADESGATVMFCTGLSQQPYLRAEEMGGKFVHRPRDFAAVVRALGIGGVRQIAPVMAEQFHLYFDDEDAARSASTVLEGATVLGRPAFVVRRVGDDVFTGSSIHEAIPDDTPLCLDGIDVGQFGDLFYRSESPKSGFHHPEGMWWVRTGAHREVDGRVPLRAVAPTVLAHLGIPAPPSMTATPIRLDQVGR